MYYGYLLARSTCSTSTSTLYSNHASTCIEHTDSCSCDLWNRGTGTGIVLVSRYRYRYSCTNVFPHILVYACSPLPTLLQYTSSMYGLSIEFANRHSRRAPRGVGECGLLGNCGWIGCFSQPQCHSRYSSPFPSPLGHVFPPSSHTSLMRQPPTVARGARHRHRRRPPAMFRKPHISSTEAL